MQNKAQYDLKPSKSAHKVMPITQAFQRKLTQAIPDNMKLAVGTRIIPSLDSKISLSKLHFMKI